MITIREIYRQNLHVYEQGNVAPIVKGLLRVYIQFWIDIGMLEWVLNVICYGYLNPFDNTSPGIYLHSSQSTRKNNPFVLHGNCYPTSFLKGNFPDSMLLSPVTSAEVDSYISQIDNNKSIGPYMHSIPVPLLKIQDSYFPTSFNPNQRLFSLWPVSLCSPSPPRPPLSVLLARQKRFCKLKQSTLKGGEGKGSGKGLNSRYGGY